MQAIMLYIDESEKIEFLY